MAGLRIPRTTTEIIYYMILGVFCVLLLHYLNDKLLLGFVLASVFWIECIVGIVLKFKDKKEGINE